MPALTFVDSEHSLLLGYAQGRDWSSPWKITRERIVEDDSGSSVCSMSESAADMGGPALHERPDWPLAVPSPDLGEPVARQRAGGATVTERTREEIELGARLLRDEYTLDSSETGSGHEDHWTRGSGKANATSLSQKTEREDSRGQIRRTELRVTGLPPLDVSPVREDTYIDHRGTSPMEDVTPPSPILPAAAPARDTSLAGSPARSRLEDVEEMDSEGDDEEEEEEEEDEEGGDWSHQEAEEIRDAATPMAWPSAVHNTSDRRYTRSSSSARSSIAAPPNGAAASSNGQRNSRHSDNHDPLVRRGSQKRHTMEISQPNDRVRYSWQSLQGDEPNRPRINIIKLVSNTVTASAGFPQGEAFGFSMSPSARRIAAYNSARLYVLQTSALPVGISQDYTLKRRPLAVELADDGDILAVLADQHTINIYDIGHQRVDRAKTIKLDFPTNCIALAPTGGLLAVAYEGGIEIFSLDSSALPTDRRAVRCQRMDKMAFSDDGSTLLGTTTRINISSTMIVSVPIFPASPDGMATHEELKEAWCTELLHPENVRNSSHATFMRENQRTVNDRLFAWNGLADTFGVLNASDMQYGSVDFPVVISPPLSTCGGLGAAIHSCPSVDEHGDTIAMIVNDRTVRLYVVPQDVEDGTMAEAHSIDHELDEGYGCPFSDARWVHSSNVRPTPYNKHTHVRGRLVITSPGGVTEPGLASEETVEDIEGGRIILFDFDPQFAGQPGQTYNLLLGKSPPQLLAEAEYDVADEVALLRSRTVIQRKNAALSQRPITLGRTASTFNKDRNLQTPSPAPQQSLASRQSMLSIASMQSEAARSLPDLLERSENHDQVIEEPYAQNAPRSHDSLQRAASNVQRHRFQSLEERNQRRPSPESSGQFLALPEYTEEPNAPLPSRFRAMAGLDKPSGPPSFTKPGRAINTTPSDARIAGSASPSGIRSPARDDLSRSGAIAEHDNPAEETNQHTTSRGQQPSRTPLVRGQSSSANVPTSPRQVRSPNLQRTPTNEPGQNGTFDPLAPMPRGLRRAYSNAMASTNGSQAASLIGDWENVSPVVPGVVHRALASPRSDNFLNASVVREDEAWDVNPSVSDNQSMNNFGGRSRMFPQTGQQQPFRYSTSLINPPGHVGNVQRASSSASSFTPRGDTDSTGLTFPVGGRRMPPHMQAFRDAAASHATSNSMTGASRGSSAAASLFPTTKAPNHVPYRNPPSQSGAMGHPVTAWHPPAPSSAPGSFHNPHIRKSSSLNDVAMTGLSLPEDRSRRMGMFKSTRRKKKPFEIPGGYPQQQRQNGRGWENNDGGSRMETKSAVTWLTRDHGKCTIM